MPIPNSPPKHDARLSTDQIEIVSRFDDFSWDNPKLSFEAVASPALQSVLIGTKRISWLLAQVPESGLDRDQYIANKAHLIYALDVAYKFHQVAFDVSQEPLVGLYVHVTVPSGATI
jgi:hypothetical protein